MTGPSVRVSAYYSAPVDRFLRTDPHQVLGALAAAHSHDLDVEQRQAWEEELLVLKTALTALSGTLFHHRLADYNQAWDYALDLKNFHAGSHEASIFPILVATQAQAADDAWQPAYPDGVRPPYRCNARHLDRALLEGVAQSSGREIDADAWGSSPYQPTPTIIEAARGSDLAP